MSALLVALLMSVSAFASGASEPQLVRLMDGRNVLCQERYELGRMTFNPKVLSISLDGSELSGELELSFVSCEASGEKDFFLTPRLPLAPRELIGNDGRPTRLEYRSPDFILGDANFGNAVSSPLEDHEVQRVAFRYDLSRGLSAEQQRDFAAGKPVRARLSLMARRIAAYVRDGQSTPLGQESLGAFTFFVTVSR